MALLFICRSVREHRGNVLKIATGTEKRKLENIKESLPVLLRPVLFLRKFNRGQLNLDFSYKLLLTFSHPVQISS